MKALRFVILSLGMLALALPAEAQTREGFWMNLGVGFGSLGCEGCDGRESGISGGLSLGGTISQRLLVGAGTTGWTKEEDGARVTVSTFTAQARFYPSTTGGLFITGGLGLGMVEASFGGVSANETGAGVMLGMGYDIRVGSNMSITPYWNGSGVNAGDVNWNTGQIGLGFTIH